MPKEKRETQEQLILKHLEDHGTITPLEALDLYGCLRLAARISDLKGQMYDIETKMTTKNGATFATYKLKD